MPHCALASVACACRMCRNSAFRPPVGIDYAQLAMLPYTKNSNMYIMCVILCNAQTCRVVFVVADAIHKKIRFNFFFCFFSVLCVCALSLSVLCVLATSCLVMAIPTSTVCMNFNFYVSV